MRKMPGTEIKMIAERRYTNFIMGEGLLNGKRIALEVYRLFKKEAVRRKGLKPKHKKVKSRLVNRTKKVKQTKTEPPIIG